MVSFWKKAIMKNHLSKHTRHFVLFIILLAVAFGGCQRGVRVRGELAMLDSLVDVDYDSALSVLVQLDTRKMEKGERMYAQLLTGKAMNKADSLFTTDSVMKEVVRYFDRQGNSNQRMLAHYVLGCAYRGHGGCAPCPPVLSGGGGTGGHHEERLRPFHPHESTLTNGRNF